MRLAWVAAPIAGMAALVGALAWSAPEDRDRGDIYRQLELFADVLSRVEQDYVTEINDEEAMEAAIQGMLASLDPHSSYMNATEYREMQTQTRGEYGGLGIEVTSEDGVVRVVSPIDGTPAARAGIQAGDYLTAIDGESIVGLTLNEAVRRMRGESGSSITVTVAREDTDPFDVTLTREIINVRAVVARVEGDIGIIRISTFNERTGSMLQDAIRQVRRDTGGRLRGVVVDLRNNPGGLLDQAIEVSDAFLDGGEVVSTRGRQPEDVQRYNARRGDDLAGVPVVVLINGASASAAEIVAGALQDRNRALIVGVDSFGKGSVQTVIPLQGGRDGALRLTTARYYTPAGRSIQGAGITPDMEVAARRISAEDIARLQRLGISEADLPNALDNDSGAERRAVHMPEDQPPENWDTEEDYQLSRAMDFLRQGTVAERLRQRAG
ncbi:S41 family peptidase [Terricaulis sp.]|uniref:S41 family peptidase n=1 Tax=Terricaulis sp. TaxID=2768686 RepID=UPI000A994DF9|nr:S41 family peptidase [Terricaulis sp.]MDZ4691230.1 S41 family peptidase [Terricaulis sp.]